MTNRRNRWRQSGQNRNRRRNRNKNGDREKTYGRITVRYEREFSGAQRGESVRRTGQVSGPRETGDTRRPEIAVFGLFIGFLGLWYLHIKKEENERKEERKDKK